MHLLKMYALVNFSGLEEAVSQQTEVIHFYASTTVGAFFIFGGKTL